MKKTLHFSVHIQAPAARVWDSMLSADTYRVWTAAFCEGAWAVESLCESVPPGGLASASAP